MKLTVGPAQAGLAVQILRNTAAAAEEGHASALFPCPPRRTNP